MKKLIALIIVVCLAFAFAAGCGSVESTGDAASAETTETPVQETAAVETPALDYDALRAIHADDEIGRYGERARGHMGRVLRLALHERKTDRELFHPDGNVLRYERRLEREHG